MDIALSSCKDLENISSVAGCIISIFEVAIYILIAFAVLYTVWGAVRFIGAEGNERDGWRNVMVYGIIGIAVMVSVWGLVRLLTGTFGLTNQPVPPPEIEISQ